MIGRRPINRTAARVIATGTHYIADKVESCVCQDTPPPYRAPTAQDFASPMFIDLTGRRFGRFIALGIAIEAMAKSRWVVRCNCGNYSLRAAKSIKNPANTADACEQCRHVIYLKRSELYRRTGIDKPPTDFI